MMLLTLGFSLFNIQAPVEEQTLMTEMFKSSEFVCRQYEANLRRCQNCIAEAPFPYEIIVEERVAIIEPREACTDSKFFTILNDLSISDMELVALITEAKRWVLDQSAKINLEHEEEIELNIGDVKYIAEHTYKISNDHNVTVRKVGFEVYSEEERVMDFYVEMSFGASQLGYMENNHCIDEHCWSIVWHDQ